MKDVLSVLFRNKGEINMYNVNVLTECQDEEELAVIISSVLTALEEKDNDLIVRKLKRTDVTLPSWSAISREEF